MIVITEKQKCSGCQACANACPRGSISMKEDGEGFLYPVVNADSCIGCGLCERVCPFADTTQQGEPIEAWASKCWDDELRLQSSSGGIFSLLAQNVIRSGGVVWGAAFSSNYKEVQHISVEDNEELGKLRSSKYVQSNIGSSFQSVKNTLEEGKRVLYSGVPCQISGLKKYLGKEYENLLCVDVICHGVPSPALWRKYLDSIANKYHGTVSKVNFRQKVTKGKRYGISQTSKAIEVFSPKKNEPYMQMFLQNYSLRPSCYHCKIKENGSCADITIGDFWKIDKIAPEMNDGKGISLVILHNTKGQRFFSDIMFQTDSKAVSYDMAVKHNESIICSASKPSDRDAFFVDMGSMTIEDLYTKYCQQHPMGIKPKILNNTILKKIENHVFHRGTRELEYGMLVFIKNK